MLIDTLMQKNNNNGDIKTTTIKPN